MLFGVTIELPDIIIHQDPAVFISLDNKEREYKSVTDPVAVVHYRENCYEVTRGTNTGEPKQSMTII